MASFLMSTMYYVLLSEVALVLFLCLPVRASWRVAVVRLLTDSPAGAVARPAAKFLFVVVAAVCFDSYRGSTGLHERLRDIKGTPAAVAGTLDDLEKRYFRAQRNFYITGFALLLLVVLRGLTSALAENARLQADRDAAAAPAAAGRGGRPHAD